MPATFLQAFEAWKARSKPASQENGVQHFGKPVFERALVVKQYHDAVQKKSRTACMLKGYGVLENVLVFLLRVLTCGHIRQFEFSEKASQQNIALACFALGLLESKNRAPEICVA